MSPSQFRKEAKNHSQQSTKEIDRRGVRKGRIVCVWVRVWEWEREREKEREKGESEVRGRGTSDCEQWRIQMITSATLTLLYQSSTKSVILTLKRIKSKGESYN